MTTKRAIGAGRARPVVPGPTRRPTLADAPAVLESIAPGTFDLLGGTRLLKQRPATRAAVHAFIVGGMPWELLIHLTDSITAIPEDDVFNVIAISPRTLRRQRDSPKKPMPADLASKTWLFAETLAKAAELFGGQQEAERWMSSPAMGLDGARPVELLRTLQGAQLVGEFLERLDYGVYN